MNDDATLTLMSIGRCFVGALHGPSDKANDKVSVVNWNFGIRGAITQILQRTTLRASYRHAAQHKCCAQAQRISSLVAAMPSAPEEGTRR